MNHKNLSSSRELLVLVLIFMGMHQVNILLIPSRKIDTLK